ncbi:MAG: hypothetical protein M3321_04450 [Actinomycetota bacterium]|nr:hypothetical protein [Actinomycetota bacterium]
MRPAVVLALLAAVLTAAATAAISQARSDGVALIQPGRSIGKLRLGMTPAEARRAMGRPTLTTSRRAGFGLVIADWEYGYAQYTVRFAGRPGRLRATRIATTVPRERTSRRVGAGSLERAVRRAYPALRCEPLKTQRHGSVQLVTMIQRDCTLFGPAGRTIFTTDVFERMFEVITPQAWSRRAQVIEVSVVVPN